MQLRIFLLLFCLSALVSNVFAQDVFELSYQFKNDTTRTIYQGLLFKYPGDTGFLRLTATNTKTKKRVLYDFRFSLNPYSYGSRPMDGGLLLADSVKEKYWYCWSENFSLKEGTEIFDFNYLTLWFKQDSAKKIIEPGLKTPFTATGRSMGFSEEPKVSLNLTETDSTGSKKLRYDETGILSFKQLKNISFTKTYLKDFFITSELFYEGAYTKKQIQTARNNIKPVLHLISVINSGEGDISRNCISDGRKMSNYFKKICTSLDIPITEKKITGKDFNVNVVKTTIRKLNPGKDDIVVFFYSGHGFSWKGDQGYPFPQMALFSDDQPTWDHIAAKSINMEDIFQIVKEEGARLNLVLSDCCNTIKNRRRSEIRDTAKAQVGPGYYDMNKRTAIALFLQTRASIMISAAEKGQAAICTDAVDGFFTSSLLNSIRLGLKSTSPNPQWMDIIQRTKNETSMLAGQHKREQNIIYKVCNANSNAPCEQYVGYEMPKKN